MRTTPPVTSLPSFSRTPAAEARPDRDLGDLGEPDRAAAGERHDDVLQVARRRVLGRTSRRRAWSTRPSQPTPRTTYSALPLWITCPPAAAFDAATASTTSLSVTPEQPEPVGDRRRPGTRSGNPPTLETSATPGTDAELGADVPVLDRAQPAQVQPAPFDRVPEDLAGRRRSRAPARRERRRAAGPGR